MSRRHATSFAGAVYGVGGGAQYTTDKWVRHQSAAFATNSNA